MGRLRGRIRKLEHLASELTDRAILEDGTVIHIGPGERLDALIALIDEEPHPLHDHLERLAPEQDDPTLLELAALFRALRGEDPYER